MKMCEGSLVEALRDLYISTIQLLHSVITGPLWKWEVMGVAVCDEWRVPLNKINSNTT